MAFNSRNGVWTGDGIDLVNVASRGNHSMHGIVSEAMIRTYAGGSDGQPSPLNELGQIVYTIEYYDHLPEAVHLFTPDLSWRGTEGDNQWDSRLNWTLSLTPAHVHDVSIGNDSDLHVVGPSSDVSVKSLTIGNGSGRAKLELQPNAVFRAAESLYIEENGLLAGSGKIVSELVNNDGLIDVGNSVGALSVDGNFVQTEKGILRLEIADGLQSDTFSVAGSAMLAGSIEIVLAPGLDLVPGAYWDVLSAETIAFVGEIIHPAGLRAELLTDQFNGIDVLRVWSAPEPGSAATMIVGIMVGLIAFVRHRRR
jgi:hypothetical protein